MLHHVCNEHEWTTGECHHGPSSDPPTLADGTVVPYFCKDDRDFEVLQKIIIDEKWMKSLKFYIRSRYMHYVHTIYFL